MGPERRLWILGVWGAEALTDGTASDRNANSDCDDSLHTTRTQIPTCLTASARKQYPGRTFCADRANQWPLENPDEQVISAAPVCELSASPKREVPTVVRDYVTEAFCERLAWPRDKTQRRRYYKTCTLCEFD